MKRFFLVFSVLLILFLFAAAGAIAAVDYGSFKPASSNLAFTGGWGITLIPYYGNSIVYPKGDVFLIQQVTAPDLLPGSVVLYSIQSGLTESGFISNKTDKGFNVVRTDGVTIEVPAEGVLGLYKKRIPKLAEMLDILRSPLAIGVFGAVLIISIILWRLQPGKKSSSGSISKYDGEISSNLT